jgi:flagellar motor switch/type III secretory pathway protein FliN
MTAEPASTEEKVNGPDADAFGETALLRRAEEQPPKLEAEEKLPLERLAALPVQLDVRVPLPDFRVADLLDLAPGRVVASEWPSSDDVPLSCGDVRLVWAEFEVVDQTLAVRVTRLV